MPLWLYFGLEILVLGSHWFVMVACFKSPIWWHNFLTYKCIQDRVIPMFSQRNFLFCFSAVAPSRVASNEAIIFCAGMWEKINHWYSLETINPSPRVHRSSGRLCKVSFPTWTVDPLAGILLSPMNTSDVFSRFLLQHKLYVGLKLVHSYSYSWKS